MAQRYGGRFSTQGDTSKDTGKSRGFVQAPAQVDAAGLRSNLMFLPPLALALTSFGVVRSIWRRVWSGLLSGRWPRC